MIDFFRKRFENNKYKINNGVYSLDSKDNYSSNFNVMERFFKNSK